MMHFKCSLVILSSAGSNALAAVIMNNMVAWILMPCSVEKARRFGGIYITYTFRVDEQDKQEANSAHRLAQFFKRLT
jgi:hypothetical protein